MNRSRKVMDDETFEIIIKRIKQEKINVKQFRLHLCGEPLTDSKLFARIKNLKKTFPKSQVLFTSNFCLARDNVIRELIDSGLDSLTISLNTVDENEYKEIMGLDFATTMHNIDSLFRIMDETEKKIKVSFSIVVKDDTSLAVKAFYDKYDAYGDVRSIRLGQWVGSDIDVGKRMDRQREACAILYKQLCVLSNGDYALCCFDPEGVVGKNIKDTPIMDAYSSGVYEKIRIHHIKHGQTNDICINCSF